MSDSDILVLLQDCNAEWKALKKSHPHRKRPGDANDSPRSVGRSRTVPEVLCVQAMLSHSCRGNCIWQPALA